MPLNNGFTSMLGGNFMQDYNCLNEDVDKIVKEFKSFMKIVVRNATIDFYRKINSRKAREISYCRLNKNTVSLSFEDNDAFFLHKKIDIEKLENEIENTRLKFAIKQLNSNEKMFLYLFMNEMSMVDIAREMKISLKSVENKKSIIKNKIKKYMGEI